MPAAGKTFPVTVMGVVNGRNQLIVTAPTTPEGGLIAVHKGQTLVCRWVNASSAFKFDAHIIKILFEPIPLLYLELTGARRRAVRTLPRALVTLRAIVRTPAVHNALITDLSVGGSRIAVDAGVALQKAQELELVAKPQMLGREFLVTLRCTVTGAIDMGRRAPAVRHFGLRFENPTDHDILVLHACVQQSLALELDALTHLLERISTAETATE